MIRPVADLLADLAAIGATVRLDGDRAVLEVGDKPVPSDLMGELRDERERLLQHLRGEADATFIPHKLTGELPPSSPLPTPCAQCGGRDDPHDILPYRSGPLTITYFHSRCLTFFRQRNPYVRLEPIAPAEPWRKPEEGAA
jgi:hypothetical protein